MFCIRNEFSLKGMEGIQINAHDQIEDLLGRAMPIHCKEVHLKGKRRMPRVPLKMEIQLPAPPPLQQEVTRPD